MVHQDQIYYAETVHKFLYLLIYKIYPQLSEYRLCFTKNDITI